MAKEIQLSQGKVAIVDDEDFEYLNQWKWHVIKSDNIFYAKRNIKRYTGKQTQISMHRLIMNPDKYMKIDHIDRDGLNNQKNNLRICTNSQNCMNRILHSNNKSGFKGVYFCKQHNKFRARVCINKINKHIGLYIDAKDAARAYNAAAIKYHGEFANLNKID